MDWNWACNGQPTLSNGWRPEKGFLKAHWQGYCEALILYILALASPDHALRPSSYAEWTTTYRWKKSTVWNCYMRDRSSFISSRICGWTSVAFATATCEAEGLIILRTAAGRLCSSGSMRSAIRDSSSLMEKTAGGSLPAAGRGRRSGRIGGKRRKFFGYRARGAPFGPDDGTLAPWAVVASLPFAPEIVLPAIRHLTDLRLRESDPYGFKATFNPTYPAKDGKPWITPWHYGLNQGPIVMAIENYRTGLLWKLMSRCPYVLKGLQQAGFKPAA